MGSFSQVSVTYVSSHAVQAEPEPNWFTRTLCICIVTGIEERHIVVSMATVSGSFGMHTSGLEKKSLARTTESLQRRKSFIGKCVTVSYVYVSCWTHLINISYSLDFVTLECNSMGAVTRFRLSVQSWFQCIHFLFRTHVEFSDKTLYTYSIFRLSGPSKYLFCIIHFFLIAHWQRM